MLFRDSIQFYAMIHCILHYVRNDTAILNPLHVTTWKMNDTIALKKKKKKKSGDQASSPNYSFNEKYFSKL